MTPDRIAILSAYGDTALAGRLMRDRADIERRQARLWRGLAPTLARAPALAALVGRPLSGYPIVTAAEIRADFAAWNTLKLEESTARAAAQEAEDGGPGLVADAVCAGFSTGSAGRRGLFLASRRERSRYIGQILAKLLGPAALMRRQRIALCLRADSALYRQVSAAGRFSLSFIDLQTPARTRAERLVALAPDILVAPSQVLADLARRAETGGFIPPPAWRLFYGAEPMGEVERGWIGKALGARPDPLYQATEGFLGAPCRHGVLHLNEDSLVIERAPVAGTNRFSPVVTDLRRACQPMVRVQLDDLIEPLERPCRCGSPLLAVRSVEGRRQDLWRWADAVIPPRQVEEAVSAALGPASDWRAIAAPDRVRLETDADPRPAIAALNRLLATEGLAPPIQTAPLSPQAGPKRRRVGWSHG